MKQQSTSDQTQTQSQSSVKRLFETYAPIDGIYDEAVTADGLPRPEWQDLLAELSVMGESDLRKRWQQAQTQIERDGVTFNPHDDDAQGSRPWMLDAIPMVLAESEWNSVSSRLSQRARVIEAMLTDLLGEQTLLKEKIIPPELLFGHPAWYPSYQGLNPGRQRLLNYCVTDIARSADGKWWATGDRTRSPFGLGYVLENRVITTRMLSVKFMIPDVARVVSSLRDKSDAQGGASKSPETRAPIVRTR